MPRKPERIPPAVKNAITGNISETPRLDDLVVHFFRSCGGVKQVAAILHQEFAAAKPGSMIRQRILDMVLQTAKFASKSNVGTGDLSLVSDEDLERMAGDILGSIPVVTDGPAEPATESPPPPAGSQEAAGDGSAADRAGREPAGPAPE